MKTTTNKKRKTFLTTFISSIVKIKKIFISQLLRILILATSIMYSF